MSLAQIRAFPQKEKTYSDWIHQIQSGDQYLREDAFTALIRAFEPMANSLAYAYLNDQHLAEEAAQEAFITVYKRIDQLQEPQAFPAWFKRIVITHCDRLIRGKRVILEDIDVRYDLKNATPGPEETLVEKQLNQNLHVAIDRLPEHERDITDLFYMQGHSQKEIADNLHLPLNTVKKRLQYARGHLRGFLSDLNVVIDWMLGDTAPEQPVLQPVPIRNHHYQEPKSHPTHNLDS